MEPILTVEHLSISFTRYGRWLSRVELRPIRDLSLTVEPGQVAAVVGASGSGKSLLAHAIFHLLPRNSRVEGNILYDGAPLTPQRAAALRGREMALIPQGVTCLDPMMKVGPQVRGERLRSSRALLARYGLGPEVEDLYPFELSGGMARRVLIATATAESPRLIVADEPTPGLDVQAARQVLGRFRELAEEGASHHPRPGAGPRRGPQGGGLSRGPDGGGGPRPLLPDRPGAGPPLQPGPVAGHAGE